MFKVSVMVTIMVCLFTGMLQADTIRVPDDFAGIRDAVIAASTGDIVIVAAGSYSGADNRNIDFEGKTIALIAEDGPASTLIDCEDLGFGIRIGPGSENGTLVQGFEIRNGSGGNGGGLIINQSTASIQDCRFVSCSANLNGGGVWVGYTTAPVSIENCEFSGNRAVYRAGGLMADRAELYISDCFFHYNDVLGGPDLGGGAIFDNTSTLVSIDRCTFADNYSYNTLGAILYFAGNMVVSNSIFENREGWSFVGEFAGSAFDYDRFSCCDFLDLVSSSDLEAFISINGNFSERPLFCGYFEYDLWEHSPCLIGPCGQVGAFGQGCSDDPGTSVILSITDVGNDQGRQVRLNWTASQNATVAIKQYSVFRQIDGNKSGLPGDWDYIATVPEIGLAEYNLVVPTLCDSTINEGMCRTRFSIRSTTDDPNYVYDSPARSGYSIDNLEPSIPSGLLLAGSQLSWDDPIDPDFRFFSIYGGSTEVPDGSEAFVGQTTVTSFDVSGHAHSFFYVSATDFSGNEGEPASTANNVSGVEITKPPVIALLGNWPNPFNPQTAIAFDLPIAQSVRLQVYDISGRLVRVLVDSEVYGQGRNEAIWDGRDGDGKQVAAGVYFYRLDAGEHSETKRMALVK